MLGKKIFLLQIKLCHPLYDQTRLFDGLFYKVTKHLPSLNVSELTHNTCFKNSYELIVFRVENSLVLKDLRVNALKYFIFVCSFPTLRLFTDSGLFKVINNQQLVFLRLSLLQ